MKTCCYNNKVMIELQKEELLFDIKNTAYTCADSISSSVEDSHAIHNLYDVVESGNRDKVARILDSAVEDCKEMLYRFTKTEMHRGYYDTDDWEECVGSPANEEESYYLAMMVPKDFSRTSAHTLTVYVHDFIVNQALYEWAMLVYPDVADRFWALAEDKRKKIKEASNHSTGRSRIKLHPF